VTARDPDARWSPNRRHRPKKRCSHRPVHAPGWGAQLTFGKGLTATPSGSAARVLVLSDIIAAHQDLIGRGTEASDMWRSAPSPPEGAGIKTGIDRRAAQTEDCNAL
jgi:hypothetical protein